MANDLVISAEGLTKVYGSGHAAVCAVDDVTLQVKRGEIVLVMGPSGSGKSTLLSILGGLLRPTAGTVHLDGRELTALPEKRLPPIRARTIGFVFQAFHLLDALSVEDNVLFPARLLPGPIGPARVRVRDLLERLGLGDRIRAKPGSLSGGEKQRVALARALINEPPIILADEPTGNLDSKHGQEVMMMLYDIARDENRAVMIVTHDPRVEDVADRILWLEDGKLRDRKSEEHDWTRDPVCNMRVDRWTAAEFAEHGGETYTFCTARCRERFEAEPEKYVET